jgi:hypothetical protein
LKQGIYKKNNKRFMFACLITTAASIIYFIRAESYIAAFFVGILFYGAHALLWTDHIFYHAASDYRFQFGSALSFSGDIIKHHFTLLSNPLLAQVDSCILPIQLQVKYSGFIFDPYVELQSNNIVSRQYFERGVEGRRYLNLSRFIELLQKTNAPIRIVCRHCRILEGEVSLLGFNNSLPTRKRMLIIAPHADDAELAAFAFYKHAESALIVTVTAGEIDAKNYEALSSHTINTGNDASINPKIAAGLLKGRLRAWDSIAVPLWAGLQVQSVHLGYFCMTLKAMCAQPDMAIASQETGMTDVRSFRVFNKRVLPSDQQGDNCWRNLLADLSGIIKEYQPDIIVTPHPLLDAHVDHIFSTQAVLAACESLHIHPNFLLYTNHNHHTDMYPFGPEHNDLPLPPHFSDLVVADKLLCFPLSAEDQRDKICALKMMHDLNRPVAFKKRLRRSVQRLIGRSAMPYGDDEYLRKAVRQQELFWVVSLARLKQLFELNV